MPTVTHIWTKSNGSKIPIHLIDDEYLKNAYIRCLEVIVAERWKARKIIFNDADHIKREMESELLTLEKAIRFEKYFKEELQKRGLRIPVEKDIDLKFKEKQVRKEFKFQANKRFNDKFK